MLPFQVALADFGMLFAGFAAIVAALHLLQRKQTRRVVSTLRFWSDGETTARAASRRIDQPWSLLLQVLALALLILAITDAPWQGTRAQRDVLVVNTSAQAKNLLPEEKQQVRDYLRSASDGHVFQLIGADGTASPLTAFTPDKSEIESALGWLHPSETALDWHVVSSYATDALHAGPERPGQLAYFGPNRHSPAAADVGCDSDGPVAVGVVGGRTALWQAVLAAMPGFVFTTSANASVLIYDHAAPPPDDVRPAVLVAPPAGTRLLAGDSEIPFDPFAGEARFDAKSALAVMNAMEQAAGTGAGRQTVLAGNVEVPVQGAAADFALFSPRGRVPFDVRDGVLDAYVDHAGPLMLREPEQRLSLCAASPAAANALAEAPRPDGSAAVFAAWRWMAALAGLLLAFEWWQFARHTRKLFILKAAGLAAIVLALCGLRIHIGERPTALVLLVDKSSSIGEHAAHQAAQYVRRSSAAQVRSFGGATTGIESALMDALARAPEGFAPRLRLITDGNETEGSALRAAYALRGSGLPLDVTPTTGEGGTVRIRSLEAPQSALSGESFPVNVSVECGIQSQSELRLTAQGREIGRSAFSCRPGLNRVAVQARVRGSGAMVLSAEAGGSHVNQAIVIVQPRTLYVSGDPSSVDASLPNALRTSGFAVSSAQSLPPDLSGLHLLITSNVDMDALPREQQEQVQRFVDDGGGLIVVSGERQAYHEDKTLTTMDRLLPAVVKPPRTPDGISVVLVIDKSSSMEGRKIQLARLSASAVVDHLRPIDTIGILIFDNAFAWVTTPRKATDKAGIKRLIAGIVPDGGTQIPTAVEEAYHKILATTGSYKHIVLLTDGISEEGDSLTLAEDAARHQVTISTIGLGQDVNKPYLEKLAEASGGQSYFLDDPTRLRELLLSDIEKVQAKTAVETRTGVVAGNDAGLLKDVDFAHAPGLLGYIRYDTRPGARVLLRVKNDKHDPLLAEWGYGLGRVAVFASDAKARWASDWLRWRGFDAFWQDLAFAVTRRGSAGRLHIRVERTGSELVAQYAGPQPPEPFYYFGPGGSRGVLRWSKSATGYQARAAIRWAPGLWVVRPERDAAAMPEGAVLVRDAEAADAGLNERLLHNLAAITGGLYNPLPGDAPPIHRFGRQLFILWPLFLWAAILLMLFELAVRKLSGTSLKRGSRLQTDAQLEDVTVSARGGDPVTREL